MSGKRTSFIMGLALGAVLAGGAVWWCSDVVRRAEQILQMGELACWVDHAERAYHQLPLEARIWEMEELLRVLDKYEDAEEKRIVGYYRFLTHGRLAKLYQESGDRGKAAVHVERALSLRWAIPQGEKRVTDENALLKLIGMLDDAEQRKQHAGREPEDSSSGQCRQDEVSGKRRDPGF